MTLVLNMFRAPATALLAVAVLSTSVSAADLGGMPAGSIKDGYIEKSAHQWQGLYVGLTVGGNGSAVDVDTFGKKDDADLTSRSFSIAPVVGYNFSSGPWVWGLEADISSAGFDEKKAVTGSWQACAERTLGNILVTAPIVKIGNPHCTNQNSQSRQIFIVCIRFVKNHVEVIGCLFFN